MGLWWTCCIALACSVRATNILQSNSLTSCTNGESQIQVATFHVQYDKDLNAVDFDVSGESSISTDVDATITVSAYGQQAFEKTFAPCDLHIKQLCPIPAGPLQASGNVSLPPAVASVIPSIAFSIPDLQGSARLELKKQGTNESIACLQSSITNGKTADQPAVKYASLGVTGAALALTGFSHAAGTAPHSLASFTTMLWWFQGISMNGMLSLDYPPIYRSFSKNFGWSVGMVSWKSLQTAIDSFRARTGGNVTADGVQELANSTLVFANNTRRETMKRELGQNITVDDSGDGLPLQSNASYPTHVVSGVDAFVEQLAVPSSNSFMTLLLMFLIVVAGIAVGIIGFKILLELLALCGVSYLEKFRKRYWRFLATTMIRVILVVYSVWVLFALYQLQNADSWGARLLAGLTLGLFSLVILFFTVRVILLARQAKHLQGGMEELYTNRPWMRKYGVFYSEYKSPFWWFFIPVILLSAVKSAFIAFAQHNGLVQSLGQLGCEMLLFVLLLAGRPFDSKANNILSCIIAVVRMISVGCLLMFVEHFDITSKVKTATGIALVVMQSVITGILALLLLINAIVGFCRKDRRVEMAKRHKSLNDDLTSLDPDDGYVTPPVPYSLTENGAEYGRKGYLDTPQPPRYHRHNSHTLLLHKLHDNESYALMSMPPRYQRASNEATNGLPFAK